MYTEQAIKMDAILKKYLNKNKSPAPLRELSDSEKSILDKLWQIDKATGIVITELLAIVYCLKSINGSETYLIQRNLQAVTGSLRKQRDLVLCTRLAFAEHEATPPEKAAIVNLIRRVIERHNFIVKNVLNWNLELTPLYDYQKIVGAKAFTEEIQQAIPNPQEFSRTDTLDKFTQKVMTVVSEHGMENAYKERLDKYIESEKKRVKIREREKFEAKQERNARLKESSDRAVMEFRHLFLRSWNTLQGNNLIGVAAPTIKTVINQHGRNGYIVLISYIYHDKFMYRYLSGGTLSKILLHADIFQTQEEAIEAARHYESSAPAAATVVVGLSEVA